MNNKIIIVGLLFVLVIVGLFIFTQKQYQPNQQQSVNQQPETKAEANTITIKNFSFTPESLTVNQGTKVIWINEDSASHIIKSDTFNSPNLGQGEKYEFTFENKGNFDYSCGIHPSMKGKIIVE